MTELTQKIDFDVGVIRISTHHEAQPAPAPAVAELLAPSKTNFSLQLEEVLYLPECQEQRLLTGLTPQISHPELMRPTIFNGMITEEIERFRQSSEQNASPLERRTQKKAVKTLEKLQSLKELLTRFQHALHRG